MCSLCVGASLVAWKVKNPPAMQETWFPSLGWEHPLEEDMATYSSILAWRIPMNRGAPRATVHGGHKDSFFIDTWNKFFFDQNSRQCPCGFVLGTAWSLAGWCPFLGWKSLSALVCSVQSHGWGSSAWFLSLVVLRVAHLQRSGSYNFCFYGHVVL